MKSLHLFKSDLFLHNIQYFEIRNVWNIYKQIKVMAL